MLYYYFIKNENANRIFVTLFRFNHYGLTKNKFSSDTVWTLSKRNRVSIRRCAKFVGHVLCRTIISHPDFTWSILEYFVPYTL